MTLTYAPTAEELVAHLEHQARTSPVLRRSRLVSRVLLGMAFAAVAGLIAATPGSLAERVRGALASGAALLLVLAVASSLAGALRRRVWRRTILGPRGVALRARRTLVLGDDGIRVEGPRGETFTPWDGVYDVTELPSVVLIQVGPMAAHVVPVRAFAGPGERAAFVASIRAHLPTRAPAA